MELLRISDETFVVHRRLSTDNIEEAKRIKTVMGGTLIREQRTGNFIVCERILEADYEDWEEQTTTSDS